MSFVVVGPVDLYEITNLDGDRTTVEFADLVAGLGYDGPEVRSKKRIPLGTKIVVKRVRHRILPFDSAYVLMVSLLPPVIDSRIDVRLVLSGTNRRGETNLNPEYFRKED